METGIFIQVQAPELSVDNKVALLLESVSGEIRDSAFVSPDSIRRYRRGIAMPIPEVDIWRLVLEYVGLYVVTCVVPYIVNSLETLEELLSSSRDRSRSIFSSYGGICLILVYLTSLTYLARSTTEYRRGVNNFIEFAFTHSAKGNKILCPCKKCVNCSWLEANIVIEHLICDGFKHGYRLWIFHGEASSSAHCTTHEQVQVEQRAVDRDEIPEMLRDMAYGLDQMGEGGAADGSSGDANNDVDDFYRLVDDASQELYPGCKTFSKLNFLVCLLHTKFLGGWSDKSFDMLLDLLREAFPEGAELPKNFYEAKKAVKSLGFGYINIHACENDCILFWKQYENYTSCPKCNTSRWKMERKSLDGKRFHKVPRKVLRYFPIKERLQRLYINPEMAKNMRWHDEGRTKDGLLRHPADSPAWKHLTQSILPLKRKCISSVPIEPRNLRPRLARIDTTNEHVGHSDLHPRLPRNGSTNGPEGQDEGPQPVAAEQNGDSNRAQPKKREGRKFTRKDNIWFREEDEPLIKMEFNEFDQPVGKAAKEFPHVVGTLVRTKGFPLNHDDWRHVDEDSKQFIIDALEVYTISSFHIPCRDPATVLERSRRRRVCDGALSTFVVLVLVDLGVEP
uniref:Transposon protein, putative, CACTA, En/Spm sub-class n=1 Tax=Oryza sativa subsp. japonica TaxID=39947 RepID=Q2R4R5_ORYSJ|nr:transposon protein, putative, CACTA, En/Spm sub-class [Oryza sativa Japonica Group]